MTGARSGRARSRTAPTSTGARPPCAPSSPAWRRRAFSPTPTPPPGASPPTRGYRFYVERLLAHQDRLPQPDLGRARHLADAPRGRRRDPRDDQRRSPRSPIWSPSSPLRRSTRRRSTGSRCCGCSRRVVMVVVIASNGGVTKRVFTFEPEVDPGLVEWAASYLNERLAGLGLGARMAVDRLRDPELGSTRRRGSWRRSRAPSPTSMSRPRTRSTSTGPPGCSPRSTSPICRTPTT